MPLHALPRCKLLSWEGSSGSTADPCIGAPSGSSLHQQVESFREIFWWIQSGQIWQRGGLCHHGGPDRIEWPSLEIWKSISEKYLKSTRIPLTLPVQVDMLDIGTFLGYFLDLPDGSAPGFQDDVINLLWAPTLALEFDASRNKLSRIILRNW